MKVSRRKFIQQSSLAGMAIGMKGTFPFLIDESEAFSYESPYMKIKLSKKRPEFCFFCTDSLGGRQFRINPLLQNDKQAGDDYESRVTPTGIAYYIRSGQRLSPAWECRMAPKTLTIITKQHQGRTISSLPIVFAQKINHCTVLGIMLEEKKVKFPCLLHFPGMGTFRIYCSDPDVTLFYDADRYVKEPFVKIALSPADADHAEIAYRFESVAIYPAIDVIKGDTRFDGFRRNYINIFQMNPRIQALANNAASDACAFTLFLYTEMARHTPELVSGFTALDMVRNTLDRYLDGMKAYGQVGYTNVAGGWASDFDSLDSAPSLIIAACYYILDKEDKHWALKNYKGIRDWATRMIATDRNKDGIIEYGYSGNTGSWDGSRRPANWWDTIGFGHDDAYSNALAYRSCVLLAEVAQMLDKPEDVRYFGAFSAKLKRNYFPRFYNPDTGVLAGWQSSDGQLHDYYFTFVNSVAICYGLVEDDKAKLIMSRMLSKMEEVGFTDFRLGLPGNLIPVPKNDYTDTDKRFGYGAFQVYENGGATGCYAYYTIHALYKVGMQQEADKILMPMLESYTEGSFQGSCPGSNMTKDWKTWQGECWGYEGFLVDNYLALLAVHDYKKSLIS